MIKRMKGFTLIELLIVVAIIAILAAIAIPNFLEAQTRSKVARVRADLRSVATGIESYYVDMSTYPQQDSSVESSTAPYVGYGINDLPGVAGARSNPTFRRKIDSNDQLRTLTTPIAYLTSYPNDPFANTNGFKFNYSTARGGIGWILWSFGPDSDQNRPYSQDHTSPPWPAALLPASYGDINAGIVNGSNALFTMVDTFFYDPAQQVPSYSLISATYDPSNGTASNGDLYRTKD
jgi:prepilin-type N-terminal cleavage/methylation domain-containing protein